MRGRRGGRKWKWSKILRNTVLLALLLVSAWSRPGRVSAEEFRVDTAGELQTALYTAHNNGEDDVILLAPGTYTGNFEYAPIDGLAISLRGEDATRSPDIILDGASSGSVLTLSPSAVGGTVRLEGLTIQGGATRGLSIEGEGTIGVLLRHVVVQDNLSSSHGGGIYVRHWGNGSVTMEIWDSVVRHNRASKRGGGIHADAIGDSGVVDLLLINVLIYANQANWTGGGLNLNASEVGGNEVRALVVHSTITGNVCDIDRLGFAKGGGVHVDAYQGNGAQTTLDLYNTILYGNYALGGDEVQDLYIQERSPGETVVNAYSSDIGMTTLGDGLPTYNATNVISGDPAFVNTAAHNYHLTASSPCSDVGTTAVPDPPGLPQHDFEGQRRVIGRGPDIGADEYGTGICVPLLLLLDD